jgi:serine protease AprX
MRKTLFLFYILFALVSISWAQEEAVLRSSPDIPKIETKTEEFLDQLPSGSASSFWVFFTDKGIFSTSLYKKAIEDCYSQITPKAIQRRRLRGTKEIFDFADIPVNNDYVEQIKGAGVKILSVSKWLNGVSVEATKTQLERISQFDFVRKIQKSATFYKRNLLPEEKSFFERPKEGFSFLNYGNSSAQLAQIRVPELHQLGYTGKGVLVCILDTGFKKDHPAFAKAFDERRVLGEYDFVNHDNNTQNEPGDPPTQHNHGTSTWSTLGGEVDGELYGPAYGADFLLAKTEMVDSEIVAEEYNWVAGIEWAESLGADVVSSSLGYTDWYKYKDMDGNTAITTKAADLAVSKGLIVVNAAGNERQNSWHYIIAPADGDSVIAAGAVDRNGDLAPFSSVGPTFDGRIKPDVVACGVATYCAVPENNGFGYLSGTSLSTPLVAGVCALLLEVDSFLTPVQIRDTLWHTSSQAQNPDTLMGYGIVNAIKASGLKAFILSANRFDFMTLSTANYISEETLRIDYSGGKLIEWKVSKDASWAHLLPDSGITPSICTLSVNSKGLDDGIHHTIIQITADSEIDSSVSASVEVNLLVSGMGKVLVFPNPFKDSLSISIDKPNRKDKIRIWVFTLAGEPVYDWIVEDDQEFARISWLGKNMEGKEVTNGIYLIKIEINGSSQILKVAKAK